MELSVIKQEKYSVAQLLVRTFFGPLYIVLPHAVTLFFAEIYAFFVYVYATFFILLKGYYPERARSFFERYFHWGCRVHLRIYHLSDGYPAIGLHTRDEYLEFSIPTREKTDRAHTLLRFLFGPVYVFVPHFPVILLRVAASMIMAIPAFFIVLFTRKYPDPLREFQIGTLRYITRVCLYFFHLSPSYPPFHGKPQRS